MIRRETIRQGVGVGSVGTARLDRCWHCLITDRWKKHNLNARMMAKLNQVLLSLGISGLRSIPHLARLVAIRNPTSRTSLLLTYITAFKAILYC